VSDIEGEHEPSPPQTADEWWQLAAQHEASARILIDNKITAAQGYSHVGFAVEAALKAYICKKERFNRWPDRKDAPELYTHNLLKLSEKADIIIDTKSPYAPCWRLIFRWQRAQGYHYGTMPKKVARDFYEAAFGEYGVVEWLRQN